MKKMGWKDQTGLGKLSKGRTEPIPLIQNMGQLGLGKIDEDESNIEEYVNRDKDKDKKTMVAEEESAESVRKKEVFLQHHYCIIIRVVILIIIMYSSPSWLSFFIFIYI